MYSQLAVQFVQFSSSSCNEVGDDVVTGLLCLSPLFFGVPQKVAIVSPHPFWVLPLKICGVQFTPNS